MSFIADLGSALYSGRDNIRVTSVATPVSSTVSSVRDESENEKSGISGEEFKEYSKQTVDYIVNYLETIKERKVFPSVKPGYLAELLPRRAPKKPESFEALMKDFENMIMPGVAHWQHPQFHAYYPTGNSFPSLIANLLGDALGVVGFSWASCPAVTELEVVMLHWVGKMIGLPKEFLPLTKDGKGGGSVQSSASDCNLLAILAARFDVIKKLKEKMPFIEDGIFLSKLVGYCSKEAHSSVSKAFLIAMVKCRSLETDDKHRLRGETLRKAIEEDRKNGLIPFFVTATLGTTACCSFDDLSEIGPICKEFDLWLHIDAAYAGSGMICPEFRYLMNGVEFADSFVTNIHKWLLVVYDCSTMWVKDKKRLVQAFNVDPLYLKHNWDDKAIDYRHWGIPLSRRFRSLKLWFVLRMYGVKGLQRHIRKDCRLAKKLETYFNNDERFEVMNEVIMGLVCFRMKGKDEKTIKLLKLLNESGRIHMVPAHLADKYIIRMTVTTENVTDQDIDKSFAIIEEIADQVVPRRTSRIEGLRLLHKTESEKGYLCLKTPQKSETSLISKVQKSSSKKSGYLGVLTRKDAEKAMMRKDQKFGFYHQLGFQPMLKDTPIDATLAMVFKKERNGDYKFVHFPIVENKTDGINKQYFVDCGTSKVKDIFGSVQELMDYYLKMD